MKNNEVPTLGQPRLILPAKTYQCEECQDTGYYGDNGPGMYGNNEVTPCECREQKAEDLEREIIQLEKSITRRRRRQGGHYA